VQYQIGIVALVGSLRRDSYTRRIVNVLREIAPPAMAIEIVPIGSLPLYNEDSALRCAAATRADTLEFLKRFIAAFETWIRRLRK